MSREDSPFIYGDFWLDKRRDGAAPDIWQIARYAPGSRSVVYRSTKRRTVDLEAAKAVLRAHEAQSRSKERQDADQAELLPQLFNYLREHGPDILRIDTVKSSFRAWIGFLMQDEELGTGAFVADINKISVARFRRWRMGPHDYAVEWGGKLYKVNRPNGVSGEAVQRNIDDLRAALHHNEGADRIVAPKVPSVDKKLRSKPRRHKFTVKQLGAMIAYADLEPDVQAWLWLMIGTAARPDAALAFDPATQWFDPLIDLHPPGQPLTDKRNPVVPAIEPLRTLLAAWPAGPRVKSRKSWWRTMRGKLNIPMTHVAKTIRHTVASHLRDSGVPGEQISLLLGHKADTDTLERTSEIYAHGDPAKMRKAVKALTTFWRSIERSADQWRADHLLTITVDGHKVITPRKGK